MAKRKQQRRRAKERRHEYEEVWVDAEGNELAPEEVAEVASSPSPKSTAKRSAPARGRGRIPSPPSWRRVGKRAAIFAPLMFVTVYVIGGTKLSLTGKLFQTAILLLFFVPFSYAMDSIQYRSYQKRQGQPPKPKQKPE